MGVIRDIKRASSTLTWGWRFLFREKLAHYFIFPIILSMLIFGISWWGSSSFVEWALELMGQYYTWDQDSWIFQMLEWVILLSVRLIFLYIYFTLNKYIVLIVLSPVLAFLSEKVEEKYSGVKTEFVLDQFVRDVVRGVLLACRNLAYELGLTLLILVLVIFIPPLALISPFAIFLIQAYFYGFSFMDYTNERRRLPLRQSVRFVRKHKGFALTYGSVFSLLFYIPYLGLILAPIWMEVSATLGMIRLHEKINDSKNELV